MIDSSYVEKHFTAIRKLADQAAKANAVACEAETPTQLHLRVMLEGWEVIDGQPNCYRHAQKPGELMILNGRQAYLVLDRHVRGPDA